MILALAAVACLCAPASARLVIQPASLFVNFDGPRPKGTFTLINAGEESVRYRARAIHFRLSERGTLRIAEPDDLSLARWVRFNPTEFEIPPNGKRVIRYTILPPKDLQVGEYWGAIEFEPLQGRTTRYDDQKGRVFDITFITSALAPIFGTKGAFEHKVEVGAPSLELQEGSPVLRLTMTNAGLGRVHCRGEFQLVDGQGREVAGGKLDRVTILRGGKRTLTAPLGPELSSGDYTIKLRVDVEELEQPLTKELVVALKR
ncbi:MAG: hypothetical protein Kow0092_21680 [Deferrisomatales bacterium]